MKIGAECGIIMEEYSDEELGLCIIVLATFVHREPAAAAPLLPEILTVVSKYVNLIRNIFRLCDIFLNMNFFYRIAQFAMYPWQSEANLHLPGGAVSVAHQFLRCVLHQLAPNAVFVQIFQTRAPGNKTAFEIYF